MKTTVIHHSADYDGIFCREIARKFLPDAELIGWNFGEPRIATQEGAKVYVLDLPPECLDWAVPGHAGLKDLVWIDHHKTSIEKWAPAGPLDFEHQIPGYRIDGVAACRLAWQWFGLHADGCDEISMPSKQMFVDRKVPEPLSVRLAGEYDVWDKRDPNAEVFQHGLRSIPLTDGIWDELLEPEQMPRLVEQLLANGSIVQYAKEHEDESLVKYRSFRVKWEGLDFLTLNTARCNSLTFAALDIPATGHDALLGFYFNGKVWTVSLYHAKHRTDLDLSQIAVKYGGGGHRGACGFTCQKLPFPDCS